MLATLHTKTRHSEFAVVWGRQPVKLSKRMPADALPETPSEFSKSWASSHAGRFLADHGASGDVSGQTLGAAWERAQETLRRLTQVFQDDLPREVSVVMLGSLGRREQTSGSDADWCLLIDGRADSDHRRLQVIVESHLQQLGLNAPNPTGAFGAMVFSHELIHCIGGHADTNDNLTRRMLLLLEGAEVTPVSPVSPYARVCRAILQRYFEEESFFPEKAAFFPRFFLNDVVRFWRTMAVDYAAKTSERGPKGWALRHAKLRFSRKLLLAAGLLLACEPCLFSEDDTEDFAADEQPGLFPELFRRQQLSGVDQCFQALRLTPLEILVRASTRLSLPGENLRDLLSVYEEFLTLLSDEDTRHELKELTFGQASTNALFQNVRSLGSMFQTELNHLFLEGENNRLRDLTLKYGIF